MAKPLKIEIGRDELKEVFDYDENTGVFKWKNPRPKVKVGGVAGCICNFNGYCLITYNYRPYKAHRLAWIYVHGEIPETKFIDHIDGNRSNNSISNLRLCTNGENQKNRKLGRDNTSGFKGVSWNKKLQKWEAYTSLHNKKYNIGYYTDKEEAIAAHKAYCIIHHGEFFKDVTQKV